MFTLGIGLGIDGSNVLPESLNRQNNCLRARFDVHSCVEEVSAKSSWEEYTYLLPEAQLCPCVWQQEAVSHVRLLPTHAGRKYSFSSPSPQSVVGAPYHFRRALLAQQQFTRPPLHACTRRSQEVPLNVSAANDNLSLLPPSRRSQYLPHHLHPHYLILALFC